MITPTKTYSNNPFVDNLVYYAKLMALNCSVKDEEEALSKETKQSLHDGEVYIACIEKNTVYEMFDSIPVSILEKYIASQSNLDLYTKDAKNLRVYLNSLSNIQRAKVLNKLSSLARTVYIDHFDTMRYYIDSVGPNWLIDNEELYNKCKNNQADYRDLFDELPLKTVARIVKKYLNSHDYNQLSDLWDQNHIISLEEIIALVPKDGIMPTYSELVARREDRNKKSILLETNDIIEDIEAVDGTVVTGNEHEFLDKFEEYISTRTDDGVSVELANISSAMRAVFISHYDMMKERRYFVDEVSEPSEFIYDDIPIDEQEELWMDYYFDIVLYNKCTNGTATYNDLFDAFPVKDRLECLNQVLGEEVVRDNNFATRDVEYLNEYFDRYDTNSAAHKRQLNELMIQYYKKNYQFYLNHDVYNKCQIELLDYFDLVDYLPIETKKSILATEIGEITNLQVYAQSKPMLNSYLQTLDQYTRDNIKNNINKDMQAWYPSNHVETNNYYRALIGLPPMNETGEVYTDTLVHSWDETTNSYKEFGNRFIAAIPTGIYPESHWKQELYKFDSYDIGILKEYGIIDDYVAACGANTSMERYKYLKYLGDDKLDLYVCRKAMNFQLIGMPTVDDTIVKNKFVDCYTINRDYVIRTVYSDAYRFQSDYYNKFIIIFILINTIMDMLTGIPDFIINRDVFDARCIRYLFESFGIPYYSEIPVKYQQAMLKNLNILIKYKSSTRNMIDICNLFGFSDIRVFGYYLMKDRSVDVNTGEYLFDENNDISYDLDNIYVVDPMGGEDLVHDGLKYTKLTEYEYYDPEYYLKSITVEDENGNISTKEIINNERDVYIYDRSGEMMIPFKDADYFTKIKADVKPATVKFVRVPIDDQLTEYKNDSNNYVDYDETTIGEITWDGQLDHEMVKNDILDYNFNAVKSKYISVETITEMTELSFQVSFFYNMLFDNLYSEENLTVEVPYIKQGHKFKFMDIVCFMFAMMYYYNNLEDTIMYSPTQILYVKGYNFNEDLNTILQDPKAFTQVDEYGPLKDYEKTNIFDINERIEEDNYDYKEAFEDYRIAGFNLDADIDGLEKWLNDNYQMSLEDFIVDDSFTDFNQAITLRQFYSLNNSYYQKSIFKDNLLPLQYNNEIKYAFDYSLYYKVYDSDVNDGIHEYIKETNGNDTYFMEVINNSDDQIYIMDKDYYSHNRLSEEYALYYLFRRSDDKYYRIGTQYYIRDAGSEFRALFTGNLFVKDRNGKYIFACNKIYRKTADESYNEITEDKYFTIDPTNGNKIIKFSEYYIINDDGTYELDKENTYILVVQNGVSIYVPLKDIDEYTNEIIADENLYIRHSDGHFIKFSETDYYKRTGEDDEDYNEMEYTEEDLYVITTDETQYFDPSADPRVYYQKLSEYYAEHNYTIHNESLFVKDENGNYVSEGDLLSPNNCYYIDSSGKYRLIIEDFIVYKEYNHSIKKDPRYYLILQSSNDFWKMSMNNNKDTLTQISSIQNRYIMDSNDEYILVLNKTAQYANTNQMIVVLNKLMTIEDSEESEEDTRYNPSLHDNIWDENDWYYEAPGSDPKNDIGMNGENIWYYKKPGESQDDTQDDEESTPTLNTASGWYLDASSYMGDVELIKGESYYMTFDIESNFNGEVQIYNQADESVLTPSEKIYYLRAGEVTHVSQQFTANNIARPQLRFIKWDFNNYPIYPGDYMVISDIKILKAYSNNFISTDIPSYDKLQEIYRTNEAIYKYLVSMMNNTSDKRTYQIYKKLYDSLMTSKYNKEAFKLGENKYAKTYTEFLESRDEVLYEKLNYFKSLDEDTMHKQIADSIIEVSYAIDDCVDTYSYGYLYSYFPAVSATYIQQYISKIINWFKSWKVHLLGINTVYRFNDAFGNTIKVLENNKAKVKLHENASHSFIYDTVTINPLDDSAVNPSGIPYNELYDFDDYTNACSDKVRIRDRIRIIVRNANIVKYDNKGYNLHVLLNNTDDTAKDVDNNLVISSDENQYSVQDQNRILMHTDEDEHDVFSSQLIEEINVLSGDYVEFDELEDEEQYDGEQF